jgi:hypothetical protein
MFFAWIGTQILQRYILLPIPFWLVLYRLTEIELLLIVTLIYNKKPIVLPANKMFLLQMRRMLDSPMEGLSSKENVQGAV